MHVPSIFLIENISIDLPPINGHVVKRKRFTILQISRASSGPLTKNTTRDELQKNALNEKVASHVQVQGFARDLTALALIVLANNNSPQQVKSFGQPAMFADGKTYAKQDTPIPKFFSV